MRLAIFVENLMLGMRENTSDLVKKFEPLLEQEVTVGVTSCQKEKNHP